MPMLRRQPRRAEEGPVHLTPEGLDRMKARLASLKQALPDLASEAERTAAYGDRSDNAAYKEAKSILRRTHRQIWSIEDRLKRVVVIAQGPNATGAVQIGSTVTVEPVGGVRKTFRILGSAETNPTAGRISFQSPLGAALLNQKKGAVVKVQTQNGVREYRIIEIR